SGRAAVPANSKYRQCTYDSVTAPIESDQLVYSLFAGLEARFGKCKSPGRRRASELDLFAQFRYKTRCKSRQDQFPNLQDRGLENRILYPITHFFTLVYTR